jgi:hypothetical protein
MIEHLLFLYLRTVLQRSWDELMRSTCEPAQMQAARLSDILSRNRETVFGQEHGFQHIHTVEEFRERVPVRAYEEFEPYIARIKRGEKRILTQEDPELFGRTSGTTREPKFIPITPAFYEEFSKMQKMWQRKLLADHRRMARGKILSVMGAEIDGYTECGIPFGAMSGHSYRMQYPLTQRMYAAPYEVMCLKDFEAKYYLILRLGFEQNVTTIAALNPSTILLLMKKLNTHAPELGKDIADGTIRSDLNIPSRLRRQLESRLRPNRRRGREVEALIRRGGAIKGTDVWKELAVITTWQGGSAGFFINQFPIYFPGIPIRDMGLIATEGYVSIPLWSNTPKGLLGITGHFFEFFEVCQDGSRSSQPLGCEEVEAGKNYYVALTTSGGLYRYDICDIVEVVEFYNKTPVIVFKQKGGNIVSITGEKLTEAQVTTAMKQAAAALPSPVEGFVLVLQLGEPPSYSLFVETPERDERLLQRLLAQFEHELRRQNIEYAGKRDSQRLGEPKLCLVKNGCFEQFRKTRVQSGAPDGQYKFPHLLSGIEKFGEVGPVTEIKLGAAVSQEMNT